MRWLVPPHVDDQSNLLFVINDQIGLNETRDNFTATLVMITNNSLNHYEIITTLTFPVIKVENGTTITCAGDISSNSLTLYIASKFVEMYGQIAVLCLCVQVPLHHPETFVKLLQH